MEEKGNEVSSQGIKTEATSTETASKGTKKPKTFTDYSVQAILMRAELVVAGHQSDAEIQAAMLPFNYGPTVINALADQLAAGRAIVAATTRKRGEQQAATQNLKATFKTARATAATLALVARDVLKNDPAALISLGLNRGEAPQALSAFLLYADTLFQNALTASDTVKTALASRGYTAARLAAEKATIDALHTANQRQEQAKGDAQNLTPQQRQSLTDLDDAIMLYRKLARRALKTKPQLLEKLGIKA